MKKLCKTLALLLLFLLCAQTLLSCAVLTELLQSTEPSGSTAAEPSSTTETPYTATPYTTTPYYTPTPTETPTTETPITETPTTETPTTPTPTTPTPITPTPITPTPITPTPTTPTPDGIPFKTEPEIPPYTLPAEVFSTQIEREAALIIDDAIESAIAATLVLRDDRHSAVSFDFEPDANGYISSLSPKQQELYAEITGCAERLEHFKITSYEYGDDVVSDALDLSRALTNCSPDLHSYFTFSPADMFSSIVDSYFDPYSDESVSVNNGDVLLAQVGHDAALLQAVIRRVVAKMPAGLTTYDRYFYLAAVICAQNTYDGTPDNCFTAFGALISGRSVCEGYAGAFYLLCREANLWCAYRVGLPSGEGHVWNMVLLEDGIYNVDITWCDSFALGSKKWYGYFIKSDAAFARDGHNATDGVAGTGSFEPCPYEA